MRHQYGLNNLHHHAQYYASCITIMAQSYAPWLNAVHPQLIDVHQASIIWLNAVHQASIIAHCCASCISMLCILDLKMWIRHQYGLMLFNKHQCGAIWLNAVHASIWLNVVHPQVNVVHPQVNDVHLASVWFNAVHQASLWHSMAQCSAGINLWPDAVHHTGITIIIL